ncbi:MAG: SMC-Scp complex subunit ScpB [Rhodanobacter sp.]
MQIEQLKPIIEAALLAASQPLTVAQLGELFVEDDEVDREQITKALELLGEDCAGRGVELKEVASGFRYQVRQEVHPWISRMWTERPSRYSRALLETLALIAYRQPITRPEIEQIRGVVVSSNIIKTMEEREWIRVVGHRDVPGKPALFGTTRAFLDYFNLKSLDELPPLSEIRDMEDPQMRFEQDPLPARVIRDLPIDPDEIETDEVDPSDSNIDSDRDVTDTDEIDPLSESEGQDSHQATSNDETTDTPAEADAEAAHEVTHNASEPAPADTEALAETTHATADEAADRANADHDATEHGSTDHSTAEQDTEEYRA